MVWRKVAAEKVLQVAGNKYLHTYLDRSQEKVAEWVALRTLFGVCARKTGYKRGGEATGDLAEIDGIRETAESHVRRCFGRDKGAATTGIWHACQGIGRVGGGGY